ncbi:hypothetical protein BaRGS_00039443 [Batillaria attramentaria]|uniref:C1q domain-containing protein n=1 Tax=Batillaria attramentaria TaxID=370345 RepID=A0ABD0J3E0_9CAEN
MSREQLTREVTELKELGDRLQEQVDTLRDEKASLEARLAAIESKQAETGKKVAFLARLSVSNVPSNTPIHFPLVAFNIGTAFNPNTGVFTVPIAGMFRIYGGDTLVDLYKNGQVEVRMLVYDVKVGTSEASSITQHCNVGDRYWVQVTKGGPTHNGVHSFFSAALVSADE